MQCVKLVKRITEQVAQRVVRLDQSFRIIEDSHPDRRHLAQGGKPLQARCHGALLGYILQCSQHPLTAVRTELTDISPMNAQQSGSPVRAAIPMFAGYFILWVPPEFTPCLVHTVAIFRWYFCDVRLVGDG
jgi:hypothetical protein